MQQENGDKRDRCPEGGLRHPAGECPWCDQEMFDLHVQAKVAKDDYEERYGHRPDMSEFC